VGVNSGMVAFCRTGVSGIVRREERWELGACPWMSWRVEREMSQNEVVEERCGA